MKCPHCMTEFHAFGSRSMIGEDCDGRWYSVCATCPRCERLIVFLQNSTGALQTDLDIVGEARLEGLLNEPETVATLVKPKGCQRSPCPPEVPEGIAQDYNEACLVLSDSPKASAALNRRCLQNLLEDAAQVKPGDNLAAQIEQAMKSLPAYLAEQIDAVRNIGNFAAHPIKSQNTGQIQPVEPGEAEWNIEILEALFDFYYVKPATIQKKRQVLDKKLKDAGKKPMKK